MDGRLATAWKEMPYSGQQTAVWAGVAAKSLSVGAPRSGERAQGTTYHPCDLRSFTCSSSELGSPDMDLEIK